MVEEWELLGLLMKVRSGVEKWGAFTEGAAGGPPLEEADDPDENGEAKTPEK